MTATATADAMPTAQEQLDAFVDRFTPEIGALGRAVLARMRGRLPNAIQMVYDNWNGLVIGFCPNERPSDAVFSVVLFPKSVGLAFLQGAGLPDPHGLLQGSGTVNRYIPMRAAADFDDPRVQELIDAALAHARVPFDPAAEGRLVIRSISPKQRPRRPK
jgi:hypothetical protein